MTAAERAETYLRLMAEAELRRAAAYPGYEPPRLPSAAASAVRLSRPALAPLLPSVRTAARMSRPLLASLWPAARTTMRAARQTPAARAAEPVLWRVLRVRHTVQPLLAGRGRLRPPPAEADLDRVRRVAGTLVSAGAISEAGAREVLEGLTDALGLRGKLGAGPGYPPPGSGPWGRRYPGSPAASAPAPAAGPVRAVPVRAVPIGTRLPLGPEAGQAAEAGLLALVLGPGRAVLTAAAWPPGPGSGAAPAQPASAGLFGGITATDEHGARYQAGDTARPAHGRWSVTFELGPAPAPGTRWLDISSPASPAPVRVGLVRGPGPGGTLGPGPAGAAEADGAAGSGAGLAAGLAPAERLLDGLAETLLAEAAQGRRVDGSRLSGLTEVVTALQAAAGLAPDSAALSRLAVLAAQLGIEVPARLRPLIRPAALPAAWVSVLAHRRAADGPDDAAAAAAVLPEIEGARFALAGLDSVAASFTLRTVGWGWEPRPLPGLSPPRYSWWARDDQGRWHVARPPGRLHGRGRADLLLEFGPALHPGARSLEVIVRGPARQAAVTVPLGWLASR